MNKRQLMDHVSSRSGLTMKQSGEALDGLIDAIHSELFSGGNISLIGFGVFPVAGRKARIAQNPKAEEEMEVKARKIPVFRAGSTLKRTMNSR